MSRVWRHMAADASTGQAHCGAAPGSTGQAEQDCCTNMARQRGTGSQAGGVRVRARSLP